MAGSRQAGAARPWSVGIFRGTATAAARLPWNPVEDRTPSPAAALVALACTGRSAEEPTMPITITSPAFGPGQPIPRRHAYEGEGDNVSPPLAFSGIPPEARELALICDDPDAPRPEPWVHWVLYGLPSTTRSLPEGDAPGAKQGLNTWDEPGWGGPLPPEGHGTHHYHFRIYASDAPLDLEPGASKEDVLAALHGHVIAEGELVGTYER